MPPSLPLLFALQLLGSTREHTCITVLIVLAMGLSRRCNMYLPWHICFTCHVSVVGCHLPRVGRGLNLPRVGHDTSTCHVSVMVLQLATCWSWAVACHVSVMILQLATCRSWYFNLPRVGRGVVTCSFCPCCLLLAASCPCFCVWIWLIHAELAHALLLLPAVIAICLALTAVSRP